MLTSQTIADSLNKLIKNLKVSVPSEDEDHLKRVKIKNITFKLSFRLFQLFWNLNGEKGKF